MFRRFSAVLLSVFSFAVIAQPRVSELPSAALEPAPQRMYLLEQMGGEMTCRLASESEALALAPREEPMRVIYPSGPYRTNAGGFSITLRSTTQLDGFPAAKAAFIRAAQIWESKISNPVSVTINVDYGPTRFGTPYPNPNILGSTGDAAYYVNYTAARGAIRARADSGAETALYALLPETSTVPTDLGPANRVLGASIQLLTLGFTLPAERTLPSVGFNSAFAFDLDPSNGIDPGKFDFEAVTVHEIGHALGFGSSVGDTELTPPAPEVAPTIFDLFRFRPGVTNSTFQSAQRPMQSGGSHIHFAGGTSLAMATGRANGTGGDGQQSSHWKDNSGGNPFIGLMDPTLPSGTRVELSQADLDAFAVMGYNIGSSSGCAESEPNETTATATNLTSGTPCAGNASIADLSSIRVTFNTGGSDGLEDIYKFTQGSSGSANVTMTFASSSADLDIYLFRVNGSNLEVLSASNGATTTETINTTLAAGTYYVGVSAFTGGSNYTITATFQGGSSVPSAPTNLVATAVSQTQINLTWSDNANNETAYVVEGRVGSSGYTEVGTVSANATGASVNGLVAGTTYTFRVRARNASGDSAPSNEATATTLGGSSVCVPSPTVVCLLNNRFRVSIRYINQFANPPAPGDFLGAKLVAGSQNPDVATFGISSAQAIEVVVRIQDARPFNIPRFDIYYGGLTDLEYTVTVTDTQTGNTRTYRNPPGTVGGGVDRTSFPAN